MRCHSNGPTQLMGHHPFQAPSRLWANHQRRVSLLTHHHLGNAHSEPAQGPAAADAPKLEPMNEDGQNTPTSHDPDRADATSASPEQSTEPRPITGAVQWGSPKDRLQVKNED